MTALNYRDPHLCDVLTSFIMVENINSYQKLYLLLFFYEHLSVTGTGPEIARRLHLADSQLVINLLTELEEEGLLTRSGNRYRLSPDPFVRLYLHHLTRAFADPLARQDILAKVQTDSALTRQARQVLQSYREQPAPPN